MDQFKKLHCYRYHLITFSLAILLCLPALGGQGTAWLTTGKAIPQTNTSTITPDGTAHITRVVPVPGTVSPEAQRFLAHPPPESSAPSSLGERRRGTDAWQAQAGESFRAHYNVRVENTKIAGVPVRVLTPPAIPPEHRDRVLINLHGGGFNSDSGSLTESVPVAALSGTKTIAVLYRLGPEHPYPAALEDAVAVYREVLKTHKPGMVAIYGTSSGAILTGQVAAKLKQLRLPEPGALGIFSGFGDWSKPADSEALFSLRGLPGPLEIPRPRAPRPDPHGHTYTGDTPLTDPVLSPLFADLRGMPPTLFITSTRDMLLSGTTILHRAFLRAGGEAQLVVFEALPHAFWNDESLPETREADEIMARFFSIHLGR